MSSDNDSLCCPITGDLFRDPVLAEDGRLYEREAITRWIYQNGTSPFTRQALNINHLQPDEYIKKKANQRRLSTVTYNRDSDQVKLPRIRSAHNNHFVNRDVDITHIPEPPSGCFCFQNIRCSDIYDRCVGLVGCECIDRCPESIYDTCCSCLPVDGCEYIIRCICCVICVLIFVVMPFILLSRFARTPVTGSTLAWTPYIFPPPICSSMNQTFVKNLCIASFSNITVLRSRTCINFPYQFMRYIFQASSPNTTIIFAFEQTFGYWDMDNITLWDLNTKQKIFRNGDFESGSLSPDYSQCQSSGYISNTTQLGGTYGYSDGTNGQFGYLMQNVLINVGTLYSLEFYLQNRNGSGSNYMVLVGN